MEVARRGLNVRVAHPLLDAADVGLRDDPGAERVSQIVEAQRSQTGGPECSLVPAAKRRAIEVAASLAGEDQVVVAHPLQSPTKLRQRSGDVWGHRYRADLARLRGRELT